MPQEIESNLTRCRCDFVKRIIAVQNVEFEKLISLFEQTQYDLQKQAARYIGISATNLRKFRECYTGCSEIQQTLSVESCLSQSNKQLSQRLSAQLEQAHRELVQ